MDSRMEVDGPAALSATSGAQTVGGLVLFAEAALFMTSIMLGAAIAPGYDLKGSAISDLGAIPSTAFLFNGSLIAVGVLNIAGGGAIYARFGGRPFLFTAIVAGAGAIGAGVFPLGATSELHGLFALAAFLGFNLMPIVMATRLGGAMRWLSFGAGLVGLAYLAVMVVGDSGYPAVFGPIGHGGAERMIVYPPMLWLMTFGGYLMGGGFVRARR